MKSATPFQIKRLLKKKSLKELLELANGNWV